MSADFLVLFEQAPLHKRLGFLFTQGKDPMVPFLTADLVIARKPYYAQDAAAIGFDAVRQGLYDDLESVGVEGDSPDDRLRNYMQQALDSGVWYDDTKIPDRSPKEKLIPWLAKCVKSGDARQLHALTRNLDSIIDWQQATRTDISQMTPTQAFHRSARWHAGLKREEAAKDEIKGLEQLTQVAELDQDVSIYKLKAHDLKQEGSSMGHCIGRSPSYAEALRQGTADAYTVRKAGRRVYTVYVTHGEDGPKVNQFKGKENAIPGKEGTDVETAEIALAWLKEKGIATKCYDTSELELISRVRMARKAGELG